MTNLEPVTVTVTLLPTCSCNQVVPGYADNPGRFSGRLFHALRLDRRPGNHDQELPRENGPSRRVRFSLLDSRHGPRSRVRPPAGGAWSRRTARTWPGHGARHRSGSAAPGDVLLHPGLPELRGVSLRRDPAPGEEPGTPDRGEQEGPAEHRPSTRSFPRSHRRGAVALTAIPALRAGDTLLQGDARNPREACRASWRRLPRDLPVPRRRPLPPRQPPSP